MTLPGTTSDKENTPPQNFITANNNKTVSIPSASVQKDSSKGPRKKLAFFKNIILTGAMPTKPIIVNILSKQMEKTLLLGVVPVKKLEKEANAVFLAANSRIINLKSHTQPVLHLKYEETNTQLVRSVISG